MNNMWINTTSPVKTEDVEVLISAGAGVSRADLGSKKISINLNSVLAMVKTTNGSVMTIELDGKMRYTDYSYENLKTFISMNRSDFGNINGLCIFTKIILPIYVIGETAGDWTNSISSLNDMIERRVKSDIARHGDEENHQENYETEDTNLINMGIERVGDSDMVSGAFGIRMSSADSLVFMDRVNHLIENESAKESKINVVSMYSDNCSIDTVGTYESIMSKMGTSERIIIID